MNLKVGEKSKKSAIYLCSDCGHVMSLIRDELAPQCMFCASKGRAHHWIASRQELLVVTKDIKKSLEGRRSKLDLISDRITDFCGHVAFVYVHVFWFVSWLAWNLLSDKPFDPYPFGLLTLIVSLEAIILSTFILMSQRRQGDITEMRSNLDYQVDMRADRNSHEILSLLKSINSKLNDRQ